MQIAWFSGKKTADFVKKIVLVHCGRYNSNKVISYCITMYRCIVLYRDISTVYCQSHQGIRSIGFGSSYKAGCSAVIGCYFSTAVIGAFRSSML